MSKTTQTLSFLIVLVFLAGSMTGCAGSDGKYLRDQIEYGVTSDNFSGQWWEYYERGRSFADGKFYREAIADFQQAIVIRPQDAIQVPVNDNRVIDYYPHRELGVVYFQRKKYSNAIKELEHSIQTAPSTKARIFINKARAAEIAINESDRNPPELTLESSTSREITNKFIKTVTGVAADDTFVASIKVGKKQIALDISEKQKVFAENVALQEGNNTIRVVATDLTGKSTERVLEIYSDRQGPQIEIEKLKTADNQINLAGSVSDDMSLSSLRINNRRWPVTGNSPGYNFKLTLPEGNISIVASDHAGNVTRATVRTNEGKLQGLFAGESADQLAGDLPNDLASPDHLPANDPPPTEDRDAPTIWIEGPGAPKVTRDNVILLEGRINDASLLAYITVNGREVMNRKGNRIYFSFRAQLQEGENTFHIVAADEHGNSKDKTISVKHILPSIRQIDSRLGVAILPFSLQGEASEQKKIVHEQLIDSFTELARFAIVDPKEVDRLSRETKRNIPQPMNSSLITEFGKAIEAHAVLTGTVIENHDSIEITAHLIDTDTGLLLSSNDIYSDNNGTGSVAGLLDDLAAGFARDYPVVEGVITEVNNSAVRIDAGASKHIRPNSRLICFREGPPIRHPVTGRLLDPEQQVIGELKVFEVHKTYSRATVLSKTTDLIISDRFITR